LFFDIAFFVFGNRPSIPDTGNLRPNRNPADRPAAPIVADRSTEEPTKFHRTPVTKKKTNSSTLHGPR